MTSRRRPWIAALLNEPYAIHQDPNRSEDPVQRSKMREWQLTHAVAIDPATFAPDLQDWGPVVVPTDSFLALGDNRDHSYDSRYYGFIPLANVMGKPHVVYLSLERDAQGRLRRVRWPRIGQRVH